MTIHRPLLLAGASVWTAHPAHVSAPYDGRVTSLVCRAGPAEAERAASAAASAFERTREVPSRRRAALLRRAARGVESRRAELVGLLRDECGKPVRFARHEVTRAVRALDRCADESERVDGAVLPEAQAAPVYLRRCVPRGPVLAATTDHAPLLSACQRAGAAIAAGCPVVLLPSAAAPSAALVLGEVLLAAGLAGDAGALSVLPAPADVIDALVSDRRFAALILDARGRWAARARAGRRQVRVEAGARTHAIIAPDADVDAIVPLVAEGAFAHAGQASEGLQRLLVHADVLPRVMERLAEATAALPSGDPAAEDVVCGPIIDAHRMARLRAWTDVAELRGLRRVVGGERRAPQLLTPALYEAPERTTAPAAPLAPASGPIVLLERYHTLDEALAALEGSGPSVSTGLFTQSRATMWQAFDRLDAGTLLYNDYPGRRVLDLREEPADRGAHASARALVEDLMDVRTVVLG